MYQLSTIVSIKKRGKQAEKSKCVIKITIEAAAKIIPLDVASSACRKIEEKMELINIINYEKFHLHLRFYKQLNYFRNLK